MAGAGGGDDDVAGTTRQRGHVRPAQRVPGRPELGRLQRPARAHPQPAHSLYDRGQLLVRQLQLGRVDFVDQERAGHGQHRQYDGGDDGQTGPQAH